MRTHRRPTSTSGRAEIRRSALLTLAMLAGLHSAALAQPAGETIVINDEDPASSVPSPAEALKNPIGMGELVMELAARADRAEKAHELSKAANYYLAIAKAAPQRALGFSRACHIFEQAQQYDKALDACKAALAREGATVDDGAAFVRVLVAKKGEPKLTEVADADEVIRHVREQLGGEQGAALAVQLGCRLAVRLEDVVRLSNCVRDMQKTAPRGSETLAYRSALALAERNWPEAEQIIAEAKRANLPGPAILRMESALSNKRQRDPQGLVARPRSASHYLLFAAPVIALLTALLYFLRRRSEQPNAAS